MTVQPSLDVAPASSAPADSTQSLEPASIANTRFAAIYSPLWMAAMGALMVTRALRHWGDLKHMAFGLALALPAWIYPFTPMAARADANRPLASRYATHFAVAIALTTLLQTYFGSNLFFDRLGMQYHFNTKWVLNGTPLFLYFVTIAYFTMYYVLMVALDRPIARNLKGPARWLARFALCYAVAFGETFFMASDMISDFFSYREKRYALLIGSIGYGMLFFATLPIFVRLAETPSAKRQSLGTLVRDVLAANMLSLVAYEIFALATGRPF